MPEPIAEPVPPHDGRLCLLQVHAHPDDEASKGAGTTAKYSADGVHCVLVCCTGGEAGDILNPAVEHPGSPEAMHELRMAELRESVRVLGYDSLRMLGYLDSGMPDTEPNAHPDNFANAPLDEAVGRLVAIIRAERPQVILTYREDRNFYPHPDHIRVHEISVPAFELAGDPDAYPEMGEPWQPAKLYYVGWSIARVKALHEAYLRRGDESPYESWFERGFGDGRTDDFTTLIDVGEHLHQRRAALLAHRTQVDPNGFWMRLPDDIVREVFPWEEFVLARSLVENNVPDGEFEDDIFAGIRERATDLPNSRR
ncbi:MAG: mycothiol conjugate amidase Mca [Actinomycetota bacterium]|nr:mycothiol conjugate amidase Mca [Actinomycetota bacterium]